MPTRTDNFPGLGTHNVVAPRPSDQTVRSIRSSWRSLTGGPGVRDTDRPTLIACSGGADSAALVLALATVPVPPVIAHIVHDLRPEAQAVADRDHTRRLAESLNLRFIEGRLSVRDSSEPNAEAAARELRYGILDRMATELGTRWIATGHHADDQAETVLMRLLRGCGPSGLVGVHPSRPEGQSDVIRPMLRETRPDCERLCDEAGYIWCRDDTNDDGALLRVAIRQRVTPVLEALAPGATARIASTAALQHELLTVLDDAVDNLETLALIPSEPGGVESPRVTLHRAVLADARPAVLGSLLQRLAGTAGRDRRGRVAIDSVVRAVCDGANEPREFNQGGARVQVLEDRVCVEPAASSEGPEAAR